MMKNLLCSLALSLSVLAVAACGDDDDAHVTPPECEGIAEACHPTTSTAGQDCHENAEGVWTATECTAMEASCLALCNAETDAGVGGPDASLPDAQ